MIRLSGEAGGFHAPGIGEFFPPVALFAGTPFEMTRINIVQVVMTTVLVVFFVSAFARPQFVPAKLQNLGEMALDFVRVQIAEEILHNKAAKYVPLLTTFFWMIFALNITGIIPPMQIAGTSVVAIPFILAIVAWATFNSAGVKQHGLGHYVKNNVMPSGVPKALYLLVTPIEFVSTFLLRPMTLTIRLLANMMSGHMLLVLFFSSTSYLLFESSLLLKPVGLVAYAAGFAVTLFEILVAFLQAYIFTLLAAVYIEGALAEAH